MSRSPTTSIGPLGSINHSLHADPDTIAEPARCIRTCRGLGCPAPPIGSTGEVYEATLDICACNGLATNCHTRRVGVHPLPRGMDASARAAMRRANERRRPAPSRKPALSSVCPVTAPTSAFQRAA